MSLACGIRKYLDYVFKVNICDVGTKKESAYFYLKNKSIQEIVDELITKYGNDIGKIVIENDVLESDELEGFKENNVKKHDDLVHVATKEELNFGYYLESKVEYSVGDLIIWFEQENKNYTLYECREVAERRVTLKQLDKREYKFDKRIDFEHVEKMFKLKMNQVHAVFEDSQESINSLYGSEFNKYGFKSINFIRKVYWREKKALLLARNLISDPEVSVIVKVISYYEDSPRSCFIQDWGFIHIPKLLKEYESKKNITEIDHRGIRYALVASPNKELQIVPLESSSSGGLLTKSGIFVNIRFLFNYERENSIESIWHLQFDISDKHESYMELITSNNLKQVFLQINNIILERIMKSKNKYKYGFKKGQFINKVVVTVPQYFNKYRKPHSLLSIIVEAANSTDFEVIDIIEETHADLLYYMSNENYSQTIKPGMKIATFDIRETTFISRVYQISEYKEKLYATCVGEVFQLFGEEKKLSERDIDNIIVKKLEESIPENLRNELKLRILEVANKIKYDLSSKEKIEVDLSEIDSRIEVNVHFTREWFERELKIYFKNCKLCYEEYIKWLLPSQGIIRCEKLQEDCILFSPVNDINMVFLTGGSYRIPFIQTQIGKLFSNASIIIEEKLESITATGAAIHALQILGKEFQPYIQPIQRVVACGIRYKKDYKGEREELKGNIYNVRTKMNSEDSYPKDKPIQEIIDELMTKYGNDIGKIVIENDVLKSNELEYFKENNLKKHGDLVHVATKEKLDFKYYLESKVKYSVGDFIIRFERWNENCTLYECKDVVDGRVTWKLLDEREYEFDERIDFEYVERIFRLNMNQVHAVFEESQERINSLYSSEFNKYGFKSINFVGWRYSSDKALLLARNLISDPEVSVFVEVNSEYGLRSCSIQDRNFIHIPKLVKEYDSRTDIMGIDLGSTRCVLAVSRNREIRVIPIDNSTPGDLWTESVVSFDQEKPIIGKGAVRRLRTKPDHVIFDAKLLFNEHHRRTKAEQSIWSFGFNEEGEETFVRSQTYKELKSFSLAEINAIFLEKMKEAASEYQAEFNKEKSVKKAVITVPQYYWEYKWSSGINPLVLSAIEAAKLADIEVIDIIEETHADLLYYLSNEKYSETIKPGMNIAIFDIGGGTCVCKIYKISEHKGKKYGTCFIESVWQEGINDIYSGRSIDDIIMNELEKSIPRNLRSQVKLRTLEEAKKIKHNLSFEEKIEFDLSQIDSSLNKTVEFTREWFEGELEKNFNIEKLRYEKCEKYSLPSQRKDRRQQRYGSSVDPPFNEVNIAFLAGGTFRIPFFQRQIKGMFPNAEIIIGGELEIITATGAALHALQVLSGEVEPYVEIEQQKQN